MSKRIVVVGHGMVGQRFLESLTQDSSGEFAITMLAEEPRLAYDRVNLSKYFSGTSVEELTLTTRDFFDKLGIELYSGDPVTSIDRAGKRVITKSGAEYEYDVLILATGSSPFVPPIPGKDRPGVFVYRTIEDLEAITEAGRNSTRGVVIGGGLLGLEAAKALKDLGLTTHVVEFAPRLMAVQVDEGGGGLVGVLALLATGRILQIALRTRFEIPSSSSWSIVLVLPPRPSSSEVAKTTEDNEPVHFQDKLSGTCLVFNEIEAMQNRRVGWVIPRLRDAKPTLPEAFCLRGRG